MYKRLPVRYFFIYNDSNGDQYKWPFNLNHYLILNLAVGGDWGGVQGIDQTQFPMEMEVDYVRVYEKTESGKSIKVKFRVDMKNEMVSGTGLWVSLLIDNKFAQSTEVGNLSLGVKELIGDELFSTKKGHFK